MVLKGQTESMYLHQDLQYKVATGAMTQSEMDARLEEFDSKWSDIIKLIGNDQYSPQDINKLLADAAVQCAGGSLYPYTPGAIRPPKDTSNVVPNNLSPEPIVRQRSKARVVVGCILIIFQFIGLVGNLKTNNLHFFVNTTSFSALFYELCYFIGYFLPTLLGVFLICLKTKPQSKNASKSKDTPSLPRGRGHF